MSLRATALLATVLLAASAEAQWTSAGTLPVPPHHYTFLATTPTGDLLAATYNRDKQAKRIPALLIRKPTSDKPEVVELCSVEFPSGRGFGGIACDPAGSFFISGDTGVQESSFLRKFQPDGQPSIEFGTSGVLKVNRRMLGVEALGSYVLVAVDWGEIMVFDAATGSQVGVVPKPPELRYLRDIAIDPRSLRIFGVAQGGILTWGGGTPWAPEKYEFRQITYGNGKPMMGEGIGIDPFRRCVTIAISGSSTVLEVYGDGRVERSLITSTVEKSSMTDCAISQDGSTLFVSDYTSQLIHLMRREATGTGSGAAGSYAASTTTGAPPRAVEWKRSYTDAAKAAQAAGRPMVVYFRNPAVPACLEFEKNVLMGSDFTNRVQGMDAVFEDISKSGLLAYQFGIREVPHVVVFNSKGEQTGELGHPIDVAQLGSLMEAARK